MAKKQSHFGKAMDVLDISILELSKRLYIDKTTISKWRTGSRRLLKNSPYFDAITSYMLEKNDTLTNRPLNTLWAEVQPNADFTGPLYPFLRDYLSCALPEQPLSTAVQEMTPAPFSLPEYTCFVGVDGRKKAVDRLLCVAEQLTVPSKIKIMELEQMDWLCRDMLYLKTMMARLEKLALRGFQIELAFSTVCDNAPFRTFVMLLEKIRYLKTIKLYIINTDRIRGMIPRIYAILDLCAAVGLDSMEPSVPIHTNFYADYLNSHKYALYFDRTIELFGTTASITDTGTQIDEILRIISCMAVKKQDIFYFGDYLSVTTMSEELLAEILSDNSIHGNARERCFSYYRILKRSIQETPKEYYGIYYWNLQAIEDSLSYDYLIEHELSSLTNRQIHKSQNQYKRHLKDTVSFLENNESIRLVLRYGGYTRLKSFSWMKMNLWTLSLNTHCTPDEYQVGFLHDPHLVKIAEDICQQSVKTYPMEHSLKQYNLKILEALSNGERTS